MSVLKLYVDTLVSLMEGEVNIISFYIENIVVL